VSVINVGLLTGPLSVRSKVPGSLGKDSLFYWGKHSDFFVARIGVAQAFSGLVFVAPSSAYRSADSQIANWERLGIDDIALVLQQNRLRWYGHVLRKEDNDWVKKCMEYEVEGPRTRGRPKRTWREVVKEDCQARKLNTEDVVDRSKWRKLIKDVRWSGWVWVAEFLLVLAYLLFILVQKLQYGIHLHEFFCVNVKLRWHRNAALVTTTCRHCFRNNFYAYHNSIDVFHWHIDCL